jgi:hypothetical protein
MAIKIEATMPYTRILCKHVVDQVTSTIYNISSYGYEIISELEKMEQTYVTSDPHQKDSNVSSNYRYYCTMKNAIETAIIQLNNNSFTFTMAIIEQINDECTNLMETLKVGKKDMIRILLTGSRPYKHLIDSVIEQISIWCGRSQGSLFSKDVIKEYLILSHNELDSTIEVPENKDSQHPWADNMESHVYDVIHNLIIDCEFDHTYLSESLQCLRNKEVSIRKQYEVSIPCEDSIPCKDSIPCEVSIPCEDSIPCEVKTIDDTLKLLLTGSRPYKHLVDSVFLQYDLFSKVDILKAHLDFSNDEMAFEIPSTFLQSSSQPWNDHPWASYMEMRINKMINDANIMFNTTYLYASLQCLRNREISIRESHKHNNISVKADSTVETNADLIKQALISDKPYENLLNKISKNIKNGKMIGGLITPDQNKTKNNAFDWYSVPIDITELISDLQRDEQTFIIDVSSDIKSKHPCDIKSKHPWYNHMSAHIWKLVDIIRKGGCNFDGNDIMEDLTILRNKEIYIREKYKDTDEDVKEVKCTPKCTSTYDIKKVLTKVSPYAHIVRDIFDVMVQNANNSSNNVVTAHDIIQPKTIQMYENLCKDESLFTIKVPSSGPIVHPWANYMEAKVWKIMDSLKDEAFLVVKHGIYKEFHRLRNIEIATRRLYHDYESIVINSVPSPDTLDPIMKELIDKKPYCTLINKIVKNIANGTDKGSSKNGIFNWNLVPDHITKSLTDMENQEESSTIMTDNVTGMHPWYDHMTTYFWYIVNGLIFDNYPIDKSHVILELEKLRNKEIAIREKNRDDVKAIYTPTTNIVEMRRIIKDVNRNGMKKEFDDWTILCEQMIDQVDPITRKIRFHKKKLAELVAIEENHIKGINTLLNMGILTKDSNLD